MFEILGQRIPESQTTELARTTLHHRFAFCGTSWSIARPRRRAQALRMIIRQK